MAESLDRGAASSARKLLEPVNLDGSLRDSLFDKESRYLLSLVSLELNDLACLFVVD